jgi:hypothetical protein
MYKFDISLIMLLRHRALTTETIGANLIMYFELVFYRVMENIVKLK